MQTIKSTQIPNALRTLYFAKRTPLFRGSPGIAKTAMVFEAAKQIGDQLGEHVHVEVLHLASMSETDIRGYLVLDGAQSSFSKPSFWRSVEQHPRGILFLDEFMQAPHENQKAVAPLILEGHVGEFELPEGWMVVCAGNLDTDNAGTNSLLSHIVNRLIIMQVSPPDVDDWVGWAAKAQLAPELIAFAKLRPNVVFEGGVPADENSPYCTARSLHALSDVAKAFPGGAQGMANSELGQALMQGAIGPGPASELTALIRTAANLPTYEEIVAAPTTTPCPEKPDEAYAAIMLCVVRGKPEHKEQVLTYITRFPANYAMVGVVAAVARDMSVVTTKALTKWADENRDTLRKLGKFVQGISK